MVWIIVFKNLFTNQLFSSFMMYLCHSGRSDTAMVFQI